MKEGSNRSKRGRRAGGEAAGGSPVVASVSWAIRGWGAGLGEGRGCAAVKSGVGRELTRSMRAHSRLGVRS